MYIYAQLNSTYFVTIHIIIRKGIEVAGRNRQLRKTISVT